MTTTYLILTKSKKVVAEYTGKTRRDALYQFCEQHFPKESVKFTGIFGASGVEVGGAEYTAVTKTEHKETK
jgi:hypothetical protein